MYDRAAWFHKAFVQLHQSQQGLSGLDACKAETHAVGLNSHPSMLCVF